MEKAEGLFYFHKRKPFTVFMKDHVHYQTVAHCLNFVRNGLIYAFPLREEILI
jgi:hypothetical protein